DLVTLEGWLRGQMKNSRAQLQTVFFENVPSAVVQNVVSPRTGSGGAKGEYGKHIFEVTDAMLDVSKQWNNVLERGDTLANAISSTRTAIQEIDAEKDTALYNLALSKLQFYKQWKSFLGSVAKALEGLGKMFSGDVLGGLAETGEAGVDIGIDVAIYSTYGD